MNQLKLSHIDLIINGSNIIHFLKEWEIEDKGDVVWVSFVRNLQKGTTLTDFRQGINFFHTIYGYEIFTYAPSTIRK